MNSQHLTPALVTLLVLVGCSRPSQPSETSDSATALDQDPQEVAVAAKDALFEKLSGRLMEVMSTKGPVAAISVCSQEASEIADDVGQTHGVRIGRTAMKLRNPDNAPRDWVKPLIDTAADQPRFVDLSNGGTGALLPIKLKAQCLTCHGPPDQIAEDIRAQLSKLYPQDQATGFQDGDLRGWFWVEVPPP